MEQTVIFPGGAVPAWPAVRERLAAAGLAVQMRMIDGELSFPDEAPPEGWREIRVGLPDGMGMVTVRRAADRIALVTWGNAEGPLLAGWNALTLAFAEAGDGQVVTPAGALAAADFRKGLKV